MVLDVLPSSIAVQLVPATFFCCSCAGVCREPSLLQSVLPWAKIAADNLDVAIERFGQFDTDRNGAIDIHEMKQADHSVPAYVRESKFGKIDINGDRKITIEEFDEDAGKSIKEKLQHAVRNKFWMNPGLTQNWKYFIASQPAYMNSEH